MTTVLPLAFSPNGRTLASGTQGAGTIKLWDVYTRECTARFMGRQGDVTSLAFSWDGAVLAAGMAKSSGTAVTLWDVSVRKQKAAFKGEGAHCVAFSRDGKTLAAGCPDKTIRVWELASGKNILTLDAWGIVSVAVSPDSKMLASASMDGGVKLWDRASGKKEPVFEWKIGPWGAASSVDFSPDGTALAAGGATDIMTPGVGGGSVNLWDLASRKQRISFRAANQSQNIDSLAFSPDGTSLATGSLDGKVQVWNTSTGHLMAHGRHSWEALSVAVSPDGKTLASGGSDGQVKLWDMPIAR